MLTERLFGRNDMMVEKTLDALAMRMSAISNNIANTNTPGYVQEEVSFEDALAEAYHGSPSYLPPEKSSAYPAPLQTFAPQLKRADEGAQRLDGNTISLESQMTMLSETAIAYNTMLRRTGFKTLRDIIQNSK